MMLTVLQKKVHNVIATIAVVIGVFVVSNNVLAASSNPLVKEVPLSSNIAAADKANTFTLKAGTRTWVVPVKDVRLWFKTRQLEDGTTVLQLRPSAIYDYLNVYVSPKVNTLGKNSRFSYVGENIHLIDAGKKGAIVDGVKTSLAIRDALVSGKRVASVSMKEHRPTIFSVEDYKKLTFPTLLGTGESNFAGSPKNRIHNIIVGTQKFNGAIVMPGEELSFNAYLGNVDAENGYLPELVIKENVTTPEFGGGICQVSTTAFRAAMVSGMDVTYRRNHSYPVSYYGTPGYDATVYQPAPDFRFMNDTSAPIMLKTRIVSTKVFFEVWGTSDGRTVTVNGPFVTEKKPDGSLTAAVAQIVKKNGKSIREENFVSKYQPAEKFPTVRKENGEQ